MPPRPITDSTLLCGDRLVIVRGYFPWFSRLGPVTGIGTEVYRTAALVNKATGTEPDMLLEDGDLVTSLPHTSAQYT